MNAKSTFKSAISGQEFSEKEKVAGRTIRTAIYTLIKEEYPDFDVNQFIAESELNIYREKYISKFLQSEVGELNDLHKM